MMELFTGMCEGFFCFLHWALVASCEIFCCGECYIAAHELFSSCSKWGYLMVCGLLIVVASLVAEHRL